MADKLKLADDIRGAVVRRELFPHFQLQVDPWTDEIVAAEALCRWNHPQFGLVPPDLFIPIAEEVGVMDEVGRFMLEESCQAALGWRTAGIPLQISVNVSATQLTSLEFFEGVVSTLRRFDFGPDVLTLEITESQPIIDLGWVSDQLAQIAAEGVGISIDDYGSGYSSLSQLNNLPATELKIDRSLIQDESAETHAFLADLIDTVHAQGLRVVAEGVENAGHLDRVRELKCDRAQGFGIAMPMSKADLDDVLNSRR